METSCINLIVAAYPVIVAATQETPEAVGQPSLTNVEDIGCLGDKPLKDPLASRKVRLPYQWNPEKKELRTSAPGLILFLDQKQHLVDRIQSLILENTSRQALPLPDKLLESFKHLSSLTLKGSFQTLAFLTPIKNKLSRLVLVNTRFPLQEIGFFTTSIVLQSLDLGRNAFLKPGKNTFVKRLIFESLKNLKLDASMTWLLAYIKAESVPQLESLDLKLNVLNHEALNFFVECKSLKALSLTVNEPILLTRLASTPSSRVHCLSLSTPGFMSEPSFQAFLGYFRDLKTLRLEGRCKNISLSFKFLEALPALECIDLGKTPSHSLRVDPEALKSRDIRLNCFPIRSRF